MRIHLESKQTAKATHGSTLCRPRHHCKEHDRHANARIDYHSHDVKPNGSSATSLHDDGNVVARKLDICRCHEQGTGQMWVKFGAQLIDQKALRLALAPERKENVEQNLGKCQTLSPANRVRARADARDRMSSTKAAVMIASLPASLKHSAPKVMPTDNCHVRQKKDSNGKKQLSDSLQMLQFQATCTFVKMSQKGSIPLLCLVLLMPYFMLLLCRCSFSALPHLGPLRICPSSPTNRSTGNLRSCRNKSGSAWTPHVLRLLTPAVTVEDHCGKIISDPASTLLRRQTRAEAQAFQSAFGRTSSHAIRHPVIFA